MTVEIDAASAIVVEITGEPLSSFAAILGSEPRVETGRLSRAGEATIAFAVEPGEHTLSVTLTDPAGNVSDASVETVVLAVTEQASDDDADRTGAVILGLALLAAGTGTWSATRLVRGRRRKGVSQAEEPA